MRKLLLGMVGGFILGSGMCYFKNPEIKTVYREIPVVVYADCPEQVAVMGEDPVQPLEINPVDMVAYSKQLYSEMYDGDCVDHSKLVSVADQIGGIYRKYGFEKARELYESIRKNWGDEWRRNVCGLGSINHNDLDTLLSARFSLEDFWRLCDEDFDGNFPDIGIDVYKLNEYLAAQDRDTRSRYIYDLCEDKAYVLNDPFYVNENWAKMVLCWEISSRFPDVFIDSVSWAGDSPGLVLAYGYKDAIETAEKEMKQKMFDGEIEGWSSTLPEEQLISDLAQTACGMYKASDMYALEVVVDLVAQNAMRGLGGSWTSHFWLVNESRKLCGNYYDFENQQ